MCGIAGFWSSDNSNNQDIITQMISAISYRGPDDSGVYFDKKNGLSLGHVRLAIQDLSHAGHQPMMTSCGRYVLVFNGEIYNHHAIRLELALAGFSINWRGHSDTETLLYSLKSFGIDRTLSLSRGMFAFALWDIIDKKLTLCRDRIGEKPLYYGWQGRTFFFASEINALKKHPDFHNEINRDVLALYFRYGYVPTPYSIYNNVYKLKAGHYITYKLDGLDKSCVNDPICYWSLDNIASENELHGSKDNIIEDLDKLLTDVVKEQMISDVPMGVFLSGGIDSTLIASLMQKNSQAAINTFTVGFENKIYSEAEDAARIACHLGAKHHELIVSSNDLLNTVPLIANVYSEPFADSSQIPTYLISKFASDRVKVVLSGDGGDELFGGYNRYLLGYQAWRKFSTIPKMLRLIIVKMILNLPQHQWESIYQYLTFFLPDKYKVKHAGQKAHKLAEAIASEDHFKFYQSVIGIWRNPFLDYLSNVQVHIF
jgi:asparagine synthase (glutamine-hydrolysing)